LTKPKILLIADVRDWIFERHCRYISEILGDDFVFNTCYHSDNYGYHFDEDAYDLIYPLEFNLLHPQKEVNYKKYITGIRSHSSWSHWQDRRQLKKYLESKFLLTHVVSNELSEIFSELLHRDRYAGVVQHGVDSSIFKPRIKPKESEEVLDIGWSGNRHAASNKGFDDIIKPLENLNNVRLNFCGYADNNLSKERMSDFYRSIDTYICASIKEGHNNSLIESAFTANSIITTVNGTVPEYLEHEKSALIVDRDPSSFASAVETLRDDPNYRTVIGENARTSAVSKFDWNVKAVDYKNMFERALNEV
jgi:glycosyltransferase involved in cell wall biosynthesis